MENPYVCSLELDELSADDSIIDYSVFSDDSFLLILLLTSKGDVQAYLETSRDTKPRKNVVNIKTACSLNVSPVTVCIGSQAAFAIFGLADGNLLVTPIRLLIDVTWGGSSWATTTVIDLSLPTVDPCLATPTCTKCFVSNFPPCTMAVVANKAGNILLVDLHLRKCVSELKAPQSLHQIDILLDENSIELLVTGFTGAQWIIPIERSGKGFREVLTTCVPSDLTVLEPATMQFFAADSCGVVALDTTESIVEVYNTFHSLAHSSKRTFKVPPETWMVHAGDNMLFTVSNDNEIRSALHFGFMSSRLEYTLVRTSTNWRPLGIVAMPSRPHKLAGIFVVNERGLVRVEQSTALNLTKIASEFFFRLSPLQLNSKSVAQVANACRIDTAEFQSALIPNLLSTRKNRQLTNKELSQIYSIAKAINLSMSDLLKAFENESIGEQLLPEVLNTIQTNPAKHDNLMQRVVEMFVKRSLSAEGNMDKIREYDAELSNFLARHEHLHKGSVDCAKAGMWKCTQTLVRRDVHETKSIDTSTEVLLYIIKNRLQIWNEANSTDRLQIMSLVCHLDWSKLADADGARVCAILSAWQRDISLPSYHEMCLRIAITNSDRFPRPCQILSLVSSIHILSEKKISNHANLPNFLPLAGGNNCGATITEDDRLMIWGNFTNAQQRMEMPQMNAKSKRSDSVTNGAPTLPPPAPKPEQHLPRVLEYPGGRPRAIACGAEHILVLSSSGQLSAWGGNRFGQCGVGHSFRIANLHQVDGDWPAIEKIACGQFHSAFICSDGSLWTFGWGVWGQLGHGGRNNSNQLVPTRVNGLICKVTQIACGRAHTVVLTDTGRVLVCGSGSYGQMGVDDDIKKVFAFTPLPLGPLRVRDIATHYYHSICITEDNRVFEWGRNPQELKMRMFVMKKIRSAQLKNTEDPSSPSPSTNGSTPRVNLNLPAEIPREDLGLREVKHFLDGNIVSVACGLSHSALITSEGTLYTWGKGLDYQLGHGNKNERMEPHQVFEPNGAKWVNVSLGNNHTIASTDDGSVFAWGKNDFGQCGVLTKKNGNSADVTKKFFFQARDGRRFMPNVDESQFVQKPGLIPDVRVRNLNEDGNEGVDKEEIVDRLKASDVNVVQAVSKHLYSPIEGKCNGSIIEDEPRNGKIQKQNKYDGEDGPLCTTTALVHLIAGDVKRAIRMIEWLKTDSSTCEKSLMVLSSLVWEVMANHEDVQSREALSAAFRHVPMSDSMRKGKQIAQLWPAVWNDERVQSSLSIDEKIAMLDGFTSASKPVSCPTIPSSSLEVSSKIRVYAQCAHAEPAAVGSPPECSTCLDEWTEKVRHTLGTQL